MLVHTAQTTEALNNPTPTPGKVRPELETLEIDQIHDLGVRDLDERAQDLIAALAQQATVVPGEVFRDDAGKLWQADGSIRRESRRLRGETTISVFVSAGTQADALIRFLGTNGAARALYLSGAERARAVLQLRDLGLTQVAVAKATGIPQQTISNYFAGRVPSRGGKPNSVSDNDPGAGRREAQRVEAVAKKEARKLTGWRLYDPADPSHQYEVTISRRPALTGAGMSGRWEVGGTAIASPDTVVPDPVTLVEELTARRPAPVIDPPATQVLLPPEHGCSVAADDLRAALVAVAAASAEGLHLRPAATDPTRQEILTHGRPRWVAAATIAAAGAPLDVSLHGPQLLAAVRAAQPGTRLHLRQEGGVIIAADATGTTSLPVDPTSFPYWDKLAAAAVAKATIPADRLADAIRTSKLFTAEVGSKQQGLCVSEFRKGKLTSTNKSTLCMITVSGMEESELRLHHDDVNRVLKFLATAKSDPIEVREHPRMAIFVRGDGCTFGVTRFHETFVHIEPKYLCLTAAAHVWEIEASDLERALARGNQQDLNIRVEPRDVAGANAVLRITRVGAVTDIPIHVVRVGADTLPESIGVSGLNLSNLVAAAEIAGVTRLRIEAALYTSTGFFRATLPGGVDLTIFWHRPRVAAELKAATTPEPQVTPEPAAPKAATVTINGATYATTTVDA